MLKLPSKITSVDYFLARVLVERERNECELQPEHSVCKKRTLLVFFIYSLMRLVVSVKRVFRFGCSSMLLMFAECCMHFAFMSLSLSLFTIYLV